MKPGSRYVVKSGKFYAAKLGSTGPVVDIPKGSLLTILRPEGFPSYPDDDPPRRVKFVFQRKHYWHFEKQFLDACCISK